MARKHTFEKELKKKTRIINVKFKEVYIKWKRVESDWTKQKEHINQKN